MTWDEAYAELEHASGLLCSAVVQAYRRGCGGLFDCGAGESCDSEAFIASQRERIREAQKNL